MIQFKPATHFILLGAFSLILTACADRVRIALPPAELAECADEPVIPDIPERDGTEVIQMVRDRMVLSYLLALRAAYGDCKADVEGLKAWREEVK